MPHWIAASSDNHFAYVTNPVAHTSTSDDKVWDSGSLSPNANFSTTFSQPGTHAYQCTIHPFIRGKFVVN
jgi:plastocyanin